MPVETIIALAVATLAALLGAVALAAATRARQDAEALNDRLDEELAQWRHQLGVVKGRADDAYDRASQPSLPGEAALRLQDATESLLDLRQDLQRLDSQLKREGEQRLATEVSLLDAIEEARKSAHPPAPSAQPPSRRPRRSDSLFETVEFGDDLG